MQNNCRNNIACVFAMCYIRNPCTATSVIVSSCDADFTASHSAGIWRTFIPSCSYQVMPWPLVKLVSLLCCLQRCWLDACSVNNTTCSSSKDFCGDHWSKLVYYCYNYFFTLCSMWSRGMTKIRLVTKYFKISANDLPAAHQQSSHEANISFRRDDRGDTLLWRRRLYGTAVCRSGCRCGQPDMTRASDAQDLSADYAIRVHCMDYRQLLDRPIYRAFMLYKQPRKNV